jgi:hypothetical protein
MREIRGMYYIFLLLNSLFVKHDLLAVFRILFHWIFPLCFEREMYFFWYSKIKYLSKGVIKYH